MNTTTNRHSRSGSRTSHRKPFSSASSSNNSNQSRSRGFKGGSRGHGSASSNGRRFSGGRDRGPSRGSNQARRGGGRKIPTFDPSQFINTNPVSIVHEEYKPKNTFTTFGLNSKLARSINASGLEVPSPIQDQIIPEILAGHDVIGLAETGTGKTAAFLIPLLEKTLKEYDRQTLILAPTRELALQIDVELKKLAKGFKIFSTVCVGGTNIRPQIHSLRRKNHFVIATPGRILDLINRRNYDASYVTSVVLDEADRMLDMGFIHDIKSILSVTPADRETLFFSATMGKDAKSIVNDFLNNPITISVKKKDVTDSILQDVVKYSHHNKFETLTKLLSDETEFKRVLIFGAMKHSVEKLSKELVQNGITSESIHGNKSHGQRQRALARFKSGNARVLVATDVAARGIHVDNITHVINYDLPNTFEDYVHRIGRTGRGNKHGKALTFVMERSRSNY